ncbi:MAG TPA: hypothetical protein VK171_16240 [Fimbriimonas sp.]|nr:hypothetical protein [Fimbriimonas sp.]
MMKEKELTPCPKLLSAIERTIFGNSRGGLFQWYLKKHAENCAHCRETVDALECYRGAITEAVKDCKVEGALLMTDDEIEGLLAKVTSTQWEAEGA